MTKINKTGAADVTAADAESVHLDILIKLRVAIRAAQRHSNWIEKQCGVNGAQLWIMQELFDTPGLRVGDIAKRLAIHQTTTSNLLDVLQKNGLIIKARDTGDQRVVKLSLSEQGHAVLNKAPTPARGLLPEALRQLSPDKVQALNQGLDGLLECIGALDEGLGLLPMPFMM
jgi:DNA-binding MarR family transcriptional regulator